MILRDNGQVHGSVSGGCIEDDLIRRAAAGEFTGESGNTAAHLLRYGVTADEAHRFGLPCGGTLELVLEPAPDAALLEQLAQRSAYHRGRTRPSPGGPGVSRRTPPS